MNREELIDALVQESIDYIREAMLRGDIGLLGDYLRYGFAGFENFGEAELRLEYECNVDAQEAV